MLKVTNTGPENLADRYNGVDYGFPSGKSILIGEDAAKHIFGFGESDKTANLIRLGWLRNEADRASALSRLNAFVFDLADLPNEGDVVSEPPPLLPEAATEQGSAPLLPEPGPDAAVDTVADGSVTASVSMKGSKANILDRLAGSAP